MAVLCMLHMCSKPHGPPCVDNYNIISCNLSMKLMEWTPCDQISAQSCTCVHNKQSNLIGCIHRCA